MMSPGSRAAAKVCTWNLQVLFLARTHKKSEILEMDSSQWDLLRFFAVEEAVGELETINAW